LRKTSVNAIPSLRAADKIVVVPVLLVTVIITVVVVLRYDSLLHSLNISIFLSETRALLARSDELRTDAVVALQHVIRLQSSE